MPGPFPGMDPWLESEEFFGDFLTALVIYLREALNVALLRGYRAASTTLVWLDDDRRREPDVSVVRRTGRPAVEGGPAVALAGLVAVGREPVAVPRKQPYLEVLTTGGKRLVTAVEILSPSNKRAGSAGRKAYLDKQEEFRSYGVNLVELDLLRGGAHVTAVPPAELQRLGPAYDYHASVLMAGTPNWLYAAPVRLTDRLPAIGIPLDPDVPAVTIDLQPLLDRAYDSGRVADDIRYDRPPDPPLAPDQQAWADGVLRGKKLLPSPTGETT